MNSDARSDHGSRPIALVGSYTPADRPGIHAVHVDGAGGLAYLTGWTGITNPSFLALHPDGRFLYAVSETGRSDGVQGAVHSFSIHRSNGKVDLHPIDRRSTRGDHPCHLAVHPDGRWLVACNYGSGDITLLAVDPGGGFSGDHPAIRHSGSGPHHRQTSPHPHSAAFAPDGRHVIVADLGIDRLMVYRFDGAGGATALTCEAVTAPGAGPRHLAFHPDQRHVFVVNELDNTLSVYGFADGYLTHRQTVPALSPGAPESLAADICVSPSGDRVYTSIRGADRVVRFEWDEETGLRRVVDTPSGGGSPRAIALTPGEDLLLAANRLGDSLALVDPADGDAPAVTVSIPQPASIVFLSDDPSGSDPA